MLSNNNSIITNFNRHMNQNQNITNYQLYNQLPNTTSILNMNISNYNNMYSLQNIRSPLLQNAFNSIRFSVQNTTSLNNNERSNQYTSIPNNTLPRINNDNNNTNNSTNQSQNKITIIILLDNY